jgi:EAL domain-containing protein (putative c-di-GMP-specific phosphodiesterase class I)
MYYAKENQKNYVIFDQKMHARAISLLELETDLRVAIEKDQLDLYYQPIIDLGRMQLAGFEALVRWDHPTRGMVPPEEFVSVSEDTGLIVPMTNRILHKACTQIVKWQQCTAATKHLMVSVNISGKHFAEGDLVEQTKNVLSDTGIDPAYLKLEITETAVMENAEHAISMLNQIRATGVRLSIDDFGTGYSSLSYLHRFPIDTLKIDRSFVGTMGNGAGNTEIVKAVIAVASALNLSVIAEGIESIGQLRQLKDLGCEYGQGYLFSRPLPVGEIELFLRDESRWRDQWAHSDPTLFTHDDLTSGHLFVQ